MSALLEVKNLKKYFRTARGTLHAVDDVSFSVEEGKTLGVVGESGCGKSTLGRTILRLHDATEGQVLYQGRDITQVNRRELKQLRQDMQMIFQDPFSSLDPRMSVSQLIAEPLIIYKKCSSRAALIQKVEELMDTVGLARRLVNTYPHELDGGRRQRIGVARALSLDPKFIVCDEPVSALDVSIQAQVLNLLHQLQKEFGLTYMFVTHNMSVVRHISDNISVMYLGQLVETSPSKHLFKAPLHPYTKALLSAIPTTDLNRRNRKRHALAGEVANPINPAPGCRFAPRCPYACERCKEPQALREVSPGHYAACVLCQE